MGDKNIYNDISISTLLVPRKNGVFSFDYLKEGSIFCFIPAGFQNNSDLLSHRG